MFFDHVNVEEGVLITTHMRISFPKLVEGGSI